ncbi:MAG: primosomal protein N', partial [Terriglobales bacterium]
MALFCDVALAVPLDMTFTYAIPPGMEPVVGGRVLVPFRQQRLSGIVVELHDRTPQVSSQGNASQIKIKKVIEALDLAPVLDEHLLKLGKWIADYYLAPVGEVFRTMLPLSAEFKRSVAYRITDAGRMALHLAGMSGSPARSKRTPEQQLVEFRVLDFLAERDDVREGNLRGATRAGKALLAGMVRKKWIAREDVSAARDAARFVKVAVLRAAEEEAEASTPLDPSTSLRAGSRDARPSTNTATKLNDNQRILIETLAASGGRLPVEALRGLDVPRTTLGTLVRRGLIELVDEPEDFTTSKLKPRQSPFEFEFSAA